LGGYIAIVNSAIVTLYKLSEFVASECVYPVQVYRVFKNVKGDYLSPKDRFIYAFFCVLSKFPESQGVFTYFGTKIMPRSKVIQYK